MIEITDKNIFGLAVKNALVGIENADLQNWEAIRLLNALTKAVARIEEDGTFMTFDAEKAEMLILSPVSNEIYTANGVCQCAAFEFGKICWHRIAARLWKNYLELLEAADDAVLNAETVETPILCGYCDKTTTTGLDHWDCEQFAIVAGQNEIIKPNGGADIPYLKASSNKPVERVGRFRI